MSLLKKRRATLVLPIRTMSAMMKEMGMTPPDPAKKTIVVMGKPFDPAKPAEYINSFAIKRT